jgi:thiamine biosynthesis lipoprotein
MLADAWSTAMLVLGHERGLEIAKAQDVAVQFINLDRTSGAPRFTKASSPMFQELTA